jgi:hypothetical protein
MTSMPPIDLTPRRYRVCHQPDASDDSTELQFSHDDYNEAARVFVEWVQKGQRGSYTRFFELNNEIASGAVRGGALQPFPVFWGRRIQL